MRWFLKISGILLVLVLGILIGIDTAEQNMQKITGDTGAPKAIQVTPKDGKVEIAVLGQVVETTNPVPEGEQVVQEVKQKVAEHGKSVFSEVGSQIGSGLESATREMIQAIFAWIS